MTPDRIKSRLKFVEATPLKNRASVRTMTRREIKNVNENLISDPNDKFDTFFDYEEELSGLEPSAKQFANMEKAEESIQLEEVSDKDEFEIDENFEDNFIVMEDVSPIVMSDFANISNNIPDKDTNKNNIKKEAKFNFVRCDFIKDDGNRCKRQAPKNGTTCSVHRKLLKKRGL